MCSVNSRQFLSTFFNLATKIQFVTGPDACFTVNLAADKLNIDEQISRPIG